MGTCLSGSTGATASEEAIAGALEVRVTLIALERLPKEAFLPLDDVTRLIAAPDSELAFLPAAKCTSGSRVAFPDDAEAFVTLVSGGELGRSALIATLGGALPLGATACFSAVMASDRNSEIRICRAGDRIEIALVVEGRDDASGRELVLLDPRYMTPHEAVALVFPAPFEDEQCRALAAIVQVGAASRDDAEWAAVLEQCQLDLARIVEPTEPRVAGPVKLMTRAKLSVVVGGLVDPAQRRGILVFLANVTKASLAEDVALGGADECVSKLADAALGSPTDDAAALGWTLESTSFRLLAAMANGDEPTPEVEALLVRHAGNAGREPHALQALVMAAQDRSDLEERLLDANLDALENASPAARVRAFDWLAGRGCAPEGYDPLAPAAERRAALKRSIAPAVEGRNP